MKVTSGARLAFIAARFRRRKARCAPWPGAAMPSSWPAGFSACAGRQSGARHRRGRRRAELERVDAGGGEPLAELVLAPLRGRLEAGTEALVVRVDDDLLAGLRVAHGEQADVGQVHLQRVEEPHGRHLVAAGELAEQALPARRADEVRDDEEARAARDRGGCGRQQDVQIRGAAGRLLRPRGEAGEQVEHMAATAARRQHGVDAVAIEDRADAVATAREEPSEQGHELSRNAPFGEPVGAEVDAGGEIDQEPGGMLAVLRELPHVGLLETRGDVPVDVANVVVMLVLAQVGEVEAGAAHQRAVIALQQAVEPAQDRPLQALQERIGTFCIDQRGLAFSFGHGRLPHSSRAACREPGPFS
jgi:hypothetical protein